MFEHDFCIRCNACCMNTEMILLGEDVERISRSLGIPADSFAELRGGFLRLKNINRACALLERDSGKCLAYNVRPAGCRVYPLIYNDEKGVMLDDDCPLRNIWLNNPKELRKGFKELLKILRKIEVEYGCKVKWAILKIQLKETIKRKSVRALKHL